MRSRNQLRRERNGLVLVALTFALLLVAGVFGLLAQVQSNTGAGLGYGFVAVLAGVTALVIILENCDG